jgi:hypothetical protein
MLTYFSDVPIYVDLYHRYYYVYMRCTTARALTTVLVQVHITSCTAVPCVPDALQCFVHLCRVNIPLYDVQYRDVAALLGASAHHDVLSLCQSPHHI